MEGWMWCSRAKRAHRPELGLYVLPLQQPRGHRMKVVTIAHGAGHRRCRFLQHAGSSAQLRQHAKRAVRHIYSQCIRMSGERKL